MLSRADIEKQIRESHSGDECQLEVIFSNARKLIIEAPAGYGKTKTMISKIAFMLAANELPRPKRILALTFSVNAAYKVKRDVADQLPKLLGLDSNNQIKVNDVLLITNYHGFCRHILKSYGYLFHENLRCINKLTSVDDSKSKSLKDLNIGLSNQEISLLCNYNQALKEVNNKYMSENARVYADLLKTKLLPNGYITFNAILLITIILLNDFPKVQKFYQSYFPIIIVDEFQDTNYLSWKLLGKLISVEKSRMIFIGDSLQRIYGFIGAIEGLMVEATEKYGMTKIQLTQNYRFKDNHQMLLLDSNIRRNAENPLNPNIETDAIVPFMLLENQEMEGLWVAGKISELLSKDATSKAAVIFKQRGINTDVIRNMLNERGIDYFYAMFSDEDPVYLAFHYECSKQLSLLLTCDNRITKSRLQKLFKSIEDMYKVEVNATITSLLVLLRVFLDRVITEYTSLPEEDKILLIRDTFESKALKQSIEHISASVIVTTVHGAKGLEWDYVIMPDMERFSFPNYYGLCGKCSNGRYCKFNPNGLEREFLEELSVFYVGVTRARKQVFFTASMKRLDRDGNEESVNRSCLLELPGIYSRLISSDVAN